MSDDEGIRISPATLVAFARDDLENAFITTTPCGIERQEAQGQVDFVEAQVLPIKCPREDLEALGFYFGENDDDIFINVKFPDGWTKEATDHSMWSDLKDPSGNVRGSIFYKAAFYDRSAHMNLNCKISYGQVHARRGENKDFVQHWVYENISGEKKTLFRTERIKVKSYSDEYFAISDAHEKIVRDWISEHYPDYRDATAYWD